jgi:hypothetical protein
MHTTDRDGEERRVGDGSHDRHDSEASATVAEAALVLGISEGAVRKRVERGKLRAEHDAAGRLIVYLEGGAGATTTTDTTRDQPRQSRDDRYTISLEDQVAYLRGQLDQEREANRENRRIIAGLTQRIPELPPANEAPSSPAAFAEDVEADREEAGMSTRDPEQRMRWHEYKRGAPRGTPSQPTGAPETATSEPPRAEGQDRTTSPETDADRRPWWRRMFGS